MNLVIIGGGNMGSAVAHALLNTQPLSMSELSIVERSAEQRDRLTHLGCPVYEKISSKISSFRSKLK